MPLSTGVGCGHRSTQPSPWSTGKIQGKVLQSKGFGPQTLGFVCPPFQTHRFKILGLQRFELKGVQASGARKGPFPWSPPHSGQENWKFPATASAPVDVQDSWMAIIVSIATSSMRWCQHPVVTAKSLSSNCRVPWERPRALNLRA